MDILAYMPMKQCWIQIIVCVFRIHSIFTKYLPTKVLFLGYHWFIRHPHFYNWPECQECLECTTWKNPYWCIVAILKWWRINNNNIL